MLPHLLQCCEIYSKGETRHAKNLTSDEVTFSKRYVNEGEFAVRSDAFKSGMCFNLVNAGNNFAVATDDESCCNSTVNAG